MNFRKRINLISQRIKRFPKHITTLILAYVSVLVFLSLALSVVDDIRNNTEPPETPKIHVEPESLSIRLNGSDMSVKVIRTIFEVDPKYVNTFIEGPSMKNVVKMTMLNTSKTDYSFYASASAPSGGKDLTLQGFVRIIYSFSEDKQFYEKKIPLQVIIHSKIRSK